MEAPLVIRPRGWTPTQQVWRGRDAQGRRIQFVTKTDQRTGKVAGNSRGPSIERFAADGHSDTKVRPETVRTTIHASDLGMTERQLLDLWRWVEEKFPRRKPVWKSRLVWPPKGMET